MYTCLDVVLYSASPLGCWEATRGDETQGHWATFPLSQFWKVITLARILTFHISLRTQCSATEHSICDNLFKVGSHFWFRRLLLQHMDIKTSQRPKRHHYLIFWMQVLDVLHSVISLGSWMLPQTTLYSDWDNSTIQRFGKSVVPLSLPSIRISKWLPSKTVLKFLVDEGNFVLM